MDGYAVRSADIAGASREPARPYLRVRRRSPPASSRPSRSNRGDATRIMTGAPMPEGADSVVRVEDTDGGTRPRRHSRRPRRRRNIRPRGEDLRSGDTVLPAGHCRSARRRSASCRPSAPPSSTSTAARVWPTSARAMSWWTSTGFDEVLAGRKIVSSNNYTLHALIRAAGGIPVNLGIAPDQRDALREKIEQAAGCDAIVTTAGISVGEFDYIARGAERPRGRDGVLEGSHASGRTRRLRPHRDCHGSVSLGIPYRPW